MRVIWEEQVRQLLSLVGQGGPVVSLYLNVTSPRSYKSELHSLIHQKKQRLAESGMEEGLRKKIEQILEKIRRYIDNLGALERTRLLVLFANAEGFWQEYRLPVALPSRLYVEPDPYVRPLTTLLDEFPRYLVLVADARKARVFTLYLGEIEEHTGLLESDTPSWVSEDEGRGARGPRGGGVSAWAGWREPKIQRHIQDHVHRHLKTVTERAFEIYKRLGCDRLIIGAPEATEGKIFPMIRHHLHRYLQERFAGVFPGDPDMALEELKKRVLQVAQEAERKEEEAVIRRLMEESAHKDGMAVLGVEPVVQALMLGQVQTLIVDSQYQVPGWVCPRDHFLSLQETECELCGGKMEAVEDFVDEIVEEAVAQGAEIEHVFLKHPAFEPHRIGALLRFRISGSEPTSTES